MFLDNSSAPAILPRVCGASGGSRDAPGGGEYMGDESRAAGDFVLDEDGRFERVGRGEIDSRALGRAGVEDYMSTGFECGAGSVEDDRGFGKGARGHYVEDGF